MLFWPVIFGGVVQVQASADHIKSGARSSQYLINRPSEFYSLDLFPSLALTNQMT